MFCTVSQSVLPSCLSVLLLCKYQTDVSPSLETAVRTCTATEKTFTVHTRVAEILLLCVHSDSMLVFLLSLARLTLLRAYRGLAHRGSSACCAITADYFKHLKTLMFCVELHVSNGVSLRKLIPLFDRN